MKKLLKFAAFFALLPFLILTSCDKDEDPDPDPQEVDRFEEFKTYLINEGMDIPDVIPSTGWITTAENVYNTNTDGDDANDFFIIDIRAEADFTDGHIEGAVNATLDNVLEKAADAAGMPIVVTCYTGQTAGVAVVALRLSDYPNAMVLKWGMSSWNPTTSGPWTSHVGDTAINNTNWAAAPGDIAAATPQTAPTLMYVTDDMSEVLTDRVTLLLAGGFKGVVNIDVLDTPANYFINNFWAEEDVTHYGNIATAHRIKPLTLVDGEYAYLDGTAKVVTYCWTGQTSSMMTAYLTVLGYDAYSLKFGANGMIHTTLTTHKFTDDAIMDYPLTAGGK